MQKDQDKEVLKAISFPAVSQAWVPWGEMNLQRAHGYRAIVNPKTGKLFSIVSGKYRLIKHEDAINQVEETLYGYPQFRPYTATTEFYNDGGRMRRTYRFDEIPVKIQEGDGVCPELHLFNSYDVTWPFIVLLGAFRFVCANGLVVGTKYLYLRKRHFYDFEQLDIKKEVSTVLQRFDSQTNQWKKWAKRPLTEKEYARVMKTMKFGEKATKTIKGRIKKEAEGFGESGHPITTIWIFFNVLTWFITHRAVSLNQRVELERKLRMAMGQLKK